MSRSHSANTKMRSVRVFQGHQGRPKSAHKVHQRKIFTNAIKTRASEPYKVVNVKCHLPSSTAFSKQKKIVETTNSNYDDNVKKYREKQKEIHERYSTKKMKELYVNPNKNKSIKNTHFAFAMPTSPELIMRHILLQSHKPTKRVASENSPSTLAHSPFPDLKSTKEEKTSEKKVAPEPNFQENAPNADSSALVSSADEILAEAHRMIWLWLFNGLFPTNLHKRSLIKK